SQQMTEEAGIGIPRNGGAIAVQSEQGKSPGARRAKSLHRRQCFGEQRGGPAPARWASVAACALAQGPKRPAVTILRAAVFEPAPVEAHEVAKPPRVWIPRMLDKSGQAGRHCF